MTWGMNQTAPQPTPPAQAAAGRDHTRAGALLSALLFVPAALVTVVLTLASERASRCVTYGEECDPALPGELFAWGAGLGAVALVVALAAPVARVRQAALAVQVLAEGIALLVILSHG